MLLEFNNTRNQFVCQQVFGNYFSDNTIQNISCNLYSVQDTKDVSCPYCGEKHVMVHDNYTTSLLDMPFYPGIKQYINVTYHKYKCTSCNKVFNEDIYFKDPDARITTRAAMWVTVLLRLGFCISAVSNITGINWVALNKIHTRVMNEALENRVQMLRNSGYKPTYLAVDEFAIHKGHTYTTCVMDLSTGEVLWVGKGRSIEDFRHFFKGMDMDYLSEVKAFAMDMNASYNKLVEEYMPYVDIVFDRYHMQAQYGKDVLGSVRLEEARKHKDKADELRSSISPNLDLETRRSLKQEANKESRQYRSIKRARWMVLANNTNLKEHKKESLEKILSEHSNLAVCYAMKEEMCSLFELRDPELAMIGWEQWFKAAKESSIPQLIRFAELKEKLLAGLISHAAHSISTGKLEELNNKIKVAKRVGYDYRDDDYFFTLVRYLSLPASFISLPQKM